MSLLGVTSQKVVIIIVAAVKSSYVFPFLFELFVGNQSEFSVVGMVTRVWVGWYKV
jgi:hypothetical protein